MPLVLARGGIDSDYGVAEQVGARAIAAIVIGGRRTEGHIYKTACFICSHVPAPGVHARTVLPAIVQPGVVPHFARLRDGLKLPQLGSRARVVSSRIAGGAV